jgi:NitT/TauT family transport system ATP-binding protein
MLEAQQISKTYRSGGHAVVALEGIDLAVRAGEFMSLVGPSGCGKTTLLRIMDGLSDPSSGRIVFDGEERRGVSREMAFVFQDINLLPWRTVVENVELGLEARGIDKPERRRRALEVLSLVGLEAVADRPPYTLSGGMQQRVGVARALAIQPKVLLMDEPFVHLDNFTRETLQVELSRLWRRLGLTIVFVTHDVDEAIFLSDRIALFRTAPGRIADIVSVELPHPRWEYNVRGEPRAIALREQILDKLQIRSGLAV